METTHSVNAASLLREQFRALEQVSIDIRLAPDRQRRVLLLAEEDWSRWSAFVQGGPLPARPEVPVMLQRLAAVTYRLAALVEPPPAAW